MRKMGKHLTKGTFFIATAIVMIAVAVWCCIGVGNEAAVDDADVKKSKLLPEKSAQSVKRSSRKIREPRVKAEPGASVRQSEKVKPDFSAELSEEKMLTEEFKRMLRDLQAALDTNDKKRVFALVRELQLMDEWPDGIPKSVKLKALRSLSWFGASGISEAVGFLADADPVVREEAMDTFQQQFDDSWDLGDYELANTMKAMVKVVKDAQRLESYYDQFMNMRDTVKADTALAIYQSGNQVAIEVLEKNLDTIFNADGYEVKTQQDVERFQKDADQAYIDDPSKKQEDNDMYGPMNWDR